MKKQDLGIFHINTALEKDVRQITAAAKVLPELLKKYESDDSPTAILNPEIWNALYALATGMHSFYSEVINPDRFMMLTKEGDYDPSRVSKTMFIERVHCIMEDLQSCDFSSNPRKYDITPFKKYLEKLKGFVYDTYDGERCKKEGFLEVIESADASIVALNDINQKLLLSYFSILSECRREIDSLFGRLYTLFAEIEIAFRKYSERHSIECYSRLKHQAQQYKQRRSDPLTRETWERVYDDEQAMYSSVMEGCFVDSKEERFKLYDKEFRKDVQQNKRLIEAMNNINIDECLWFGERGSDDSIDMIPVYRMLDNDNFLLYCELALRHNLIQCEVYPELKPKFEAWLKGKVRSNNEPAISKNTKARRTAFELSEVDKRDLGEILSLLKKGAWSAPAKEESVTELIEVLYGARQDELDEDDWDNARMFREFFRTGKGSRNFTRLEISTANIVGYFMEYGYLPNSPKKASNQIFGKSSCDNNINKGKRDNRGDTFEKLIPYINKYRLRLIEKHD